MALALISVSQCTLPVCSVNDAGIMINSISCFCCSLKILKSQVITTCDTALPTGVSITLISSPGIKYLDSLYDLLILVASHQTSVSCCKLTPVWP